MLFEETSKTKLLSQKIDELLRNYKNLKEENERLKNEITSLKASNEAKDIHIKRLEERVSVSDVESEDILSKIEEVLNR
jgi:site-specific DNA-adenine methylase